jgi:hypothetical protein
MSVAVVTDTAERDFSSLLERFDLVSLAGLRDKFLRHYWRCELIGIARYVAAGDSYGLGNRLEDLLLFWLLGKINGVDIPAGYDSIEDAIWGLALSHLMVEEIKE